MKNLFKVTITKQQAGKVNVFESQSENQVKAIIEKYHDAELPMPKMDGNSYELNNDEYILIEKD